MDIPFSSKDIIFGGIVPAMVAAVVLFFRRFGLASYNRHSASIAMVAGFLAGNGLLSLAPWNPTAHWHWLPYALIVATIVGPIGCAQGVKIVERTMLYLHVALFAGWVLVPNWEDLTPSRTVHLAVFVTYVVALAFFFRPLLNRYPGPLMPFLLWATMTGAAVVLALSGSLRFAQFAIALAGAVFGIVVIATVWRDENHLNGIALLFFVASVGCLLIGRVNSFSDVPLASYMMVPAAPLLAWCGSLSPLRRLVGTKRFLAVAVIPCLFLAIAVLLAFMAEAGGETY